MRPRHIAAENPAVGLHCGDRGGASMRPRHIAAENIFPHANLNALFASFNEAAAYSRGKRGGGVARGGMRWAGFNEAAAYSRGKLRGVLLPCIGGSTASMRPRHIAAENQKSGVAPGVVRRASMRPRHIAAENIPDPPAATARSSCFNEAAAYSRGKRGRLRRTGELEGLASMRPRHIAAENDRRGWERAEAIYGASMRPRHIAAENTITGNDTAARSLSLQ